MKHILYIMSAIFGLAVLLSACSDGVAYDKYKSTSVEGWESNDTVTFDVPRLRLGGRYGQTIGLRTTGAYPFTALSLIVERVVEPGHRAYADTIDCRLYDDKGNVLGRGVTTYQYSFNLPSIDLRKGDSLHVSVRHFMKREVLPGVSDIGYRLAVE